MPATIRLELFTSSPISALPFYANTLNFQILVRKNNDAYIFLRRDDIYLALLAEPASLNASSSSSSSPHEPCGGVAVTNARAALLERTKFRRPPYGVEIVIEVDGLLGERDRIVGAGYELAADVKEQERGLTDFRVVDGDGYFLDEMVWRLSSREPGASMNLVT